MRIDRIAGIAIAFGIGTFFLAAPISIDSSGVSMNQAIAQYGDNDQQGQQRERRTRKTPTLRQRVYEDISEAQELYDQKKVGEALEILEDLSDDDLNAYEAAIMWQMFAFMYYEREQYQDAIQSYKNVLAQENIPESLEISTLYALAQMYFVVEDYEKSIEYMEEWFTWSENPGSTPYILLGQAYYQLNEFEKALEPIQTAINVARQQGREVKENWWLLVRSIYFEQENYEKVKEVLETLIINFPKPNYWRQLAGIYGELKDEQKQLAVMEIAYKQGYLERGTNLKNLAQLYLYHSVPIKATWVIESALEEGSMEANADNLELLSQSYLNAQENDKAIPPLRRAAELSGDGEMWLRLGQLYSEKADWENAAEALDNAVESGDIRNPATANLLRGQAELNQENWDAARAAFRAASRDEEYGQQARQWLRYVDRERERVEFIARYLGDNN